MHGKNPLRASENEAGDTLAIQKIFPTRQGEGPRAGEKAIFIRLGGCNLACDFCDTEFESFKDQPLTEIMQRVNELAESDTKLVVITGGEPLRQNITPLCEALIAKGFTVQIETNGTLWRELPKEVEVVCSPKNTGKGYFPLREDVAARANALKFIVSLTHALYRDVPEVGQTKFGTPVFVQPMDEGDAAKNAANIMQASKLAETRGYRLSLQMHKIWGVE